MFDAAGTRRLWFVHGGAGYRGFRSWRASRAELVHVGRGRKGGRDAGVLFGDAVMLRETDARSRAWVRPV